MQSVDRNSVIVLFDVDGTLTKPRLSATQDMHEMLQALRKKVSVGIVGGSDISKIKEQLGDNMITEFEFVFAENGTVAYRDGKFVDNPNASVKAFMGEAQLASFKKFCEDYSNKLDIPLLKGVNRSERLIVEIRNGMINIAPIGRNISQKDREEFFEYDKIHKIRTKMVEAMKAAFPNAGLTYSIGGQISIDVFPIGWNKTYCLRYVKHFPKIYFFGDKTKPGENDYEISTAEGVIGNSVTDPSHTKELVTKLFLQ